MKVDRSILIMNKQFMGDTSYPDKIESSIEHLANMIDQNDNDTSGLLRENEVNKDKINNVQAQLDQMSITGEPSLELGQARVNAKGKAFMTVKERLDDSDGRLEITSDFNLYPQSPKPPKSGIQQNTPKIVRKTNDNRLDIVQKTNKGYVHYLFEKNNGSSVAGRDYGANHELIRIIGARHIQDAYVYYDISNPLTGSLTTQYAPGLYNTLESLLFLLPQRNDGRTLSSKSGQLGVGAYQLAASSEVTYEINATRNKKANLLLFCTSGGSQDVQISVNNILVKSVNPRSFVTTGASPSSVALIEFEIPSKSNTSDKIAIKIRNNSASGVAYPCAVNYYELKDYRYQSITDWKAFGSSKLGWIESNGASDYALFDKDVNMWFGSYHGGEVSEYDRVIWNTAIADRGSDYMYNLVPFNTIITGEWRIMPVFEIQQRTTLANNKAKMTSRFDFNIDGTVEMDFGYSDGNVNLSVFYTALTSTGTNFSQLFHPVYKEFGTPTDGFYSFPTTEGKISQVNPTDNLQLDIRFTKFNQSKDSRGTTIADNTAYRKFYYAPVYNPVDGNGVKVTNLSFSKGLDFIVR